MILLRNVGLALTLLVTSHASARSYRYYLDAAKAEQVMAQITLKPRLTEDKWLKVVGDRRDEFYTVLEGDTLWDISRKEFRDPYLWRKMWQTNPKLTNPHELTPGEILAYYHEDVDPNAIRIPLVKLIPGLNGSVSDLDSDSFINVDIKNRYLALVFVITDEDLLGEITGAYNENHGVNVHEDIYADVYDRQQAKVGTRFAVVHIERDVQDKSQRNAPILGTLVRLVGMVEIKNIGERLLKVTLKEHYGIVRRGDRLVAVQKPVQWSASFHPPDDLTAKIVVGEEPEHRVFGQGEIVLLNKGKNDGVQDGFLFRLFDDLDPMTKRRDGVEPEFKGELQVIHTDAMSSIAYILRNKKPVFIGDLAVPYQSFPTNPPPPEKTVNMIEIP